MDLINCIKIYEDNYSIKTLAISTDKKYCYSWGQGDCLNIINDNIISDFQEL